MALSVKLHIKVSFISISIIIFISRYKMFIKVQFSAHFLYIKCANFVDKMRRKCYI